VNQHAVGNAFAHGLFLEILYVTAETVADVSANLDCSGPARGSARVARRIGVLRGLDIRHGGHGAKRSEDRNGLVVELKLVETESDLASRVTRGRGGGDDDAVQSGASRNLVVIGERNVLHDAGFDGVVFRGIIGRKRVLDANRKNGARRNVQRFLNGGGIEAWYEQKKREGGGEWAEESQR